MKLIDRTGQRYGRLFVLERASDYIQPNGKKVIMWLCRCDCGNTCIVSGGHLQSGHTTSCGCYCRERTSETHLIELIGQRFGRLVVLSRAENASSKESITITQWLCQCDCGNQTIVRANKLQNGWTQSCGCLAAELASERFTKHGGKHERLYGVWCAMLSRCYNPNNQAYSRYGGRGIGVCEEWRDDYISFKEWVLSNGYNPDAQRSECTIDRIDNDGNYAPSNCRIVDFTVQANNTRSNHILTYNGVSNTVAEWARIMGILYDTLHGRIKYQHWDVEKTLTTPVRAKR